MLDVAFTNAPATEEAQVAYDGIALAQQIRTLQTRALQKSASGLPEFPLVRFSKQDVVREYVNKDTTSDDLFDEKVYKEETIENSVEVAAKLFSLAADYPAVSEFAGSDQGDQALAKLLGCPTELLQRLDARVFVGLRREGSPAHLLSIYITDALLGRPGPLVDELLLAVRVGVDLKSPDWPALKEILRRVAYAGVFGGGYPRWWMVSLLDWWTEVIDGDRMPFRLTASERVHVLSTKLNLSGLVAIPDDPASPGSRFWHRCLFSGRPVDPAMGFPLMPIWGQQVWQDTDYTCLEEARRHSRHPRLEKRERVRLANWKTL